MVANTGTYLDSPFHRFAEGVDELPLERLADLDAITVRMGANDGRGITSAAFPGLDVPAARRSSSTPAGTSTGGPSSISKGIHF